MDETVQTLAGGFLWVYGMVLLVTACVRTFQPRVYTWMGVLTTFVGALGCLTLSAAIQGWL
jgi:hypothetical protein